MFRRYSCGCVALVLSTRFDNEAAIYVIEACDSDGDGLGLRRRDNLADKRSSPLGFDESLALVDKLAVLVFDGQRFRELRYMLRSMVAP